MNARLETGKTQCGDDWPGIFIRGDNALYFAMNLHALLSGSDDLFVRKAVEGLAKTLSSADIRNDIPAQLVILAAAQEQEEG